MTPQRLAELLLRSVEDLKSEGYDLKAAVKDIIALSAHAELYADEDATHGNEEEWLVKWRTAAELYLEQRGDKL